MVCQPIRKDVGVWEFTVTYTPNYKLDKQAIGGGHHTAPTKGFFTGTKIYELDVKGQYSHIVIVNNFSFDTLNCAAAKIMKMHASNRRLLKQ